MTLREINTSDQNYEFVQKLLTEAFPIDERRDVDQQRYNADFNPLFHTVLITNGNSETAEDPFDFRSIERHNDSEFLKTERKNDDAFLKFEKTHHSTIIQSQSLSDDRPLGFITYWDFGTFRYVEHFAMDSNLRNQGLGRKAFTEFIRQEDTPVVLEVELPTDSISRRRIKFYERIGLRLWADHPYVQPSYREGGNTVDMYLMASSNLSPDRFEDIKRQIHHSVYHQ